VGDHDDKVLVLEGCQGLATRFRISVGASEPGGENVPARHAAYAPLQAATRSSRVRPVQPPSRPPVKEPQRRRTRLQQAQELARTRHPDTTSTPWCTGVAWSSPRSSSGSH